MMLDPRDAVLALANQADDLATRLRSEAAQVSDQRTDPGWTGPAAESKAAQVERVAGHLRLTASEMDEVAESLRVHAQLASQNFGEITRRIGNAVNQLGHLGQWQDPKSLDI